MIHLLNGLWQGVLLTALVWCILKIIPRANAATRYAVWWVALLAVLILPLRPLLIGSTSRPGIPSPMETAPAGVAAVSDTAVALLAQPEPMRMSDVDADARPRLLPIHVPAGPVSIALVCLWSVLSLALFVRLAKSFRVLRGLKRSATAAPLDLQTRVNDLAKLVGVRRNARLLVSDQVAAPMALGLLDPAILLPSSIADQLSDSDFDQVALHELAHLRRYDDWMNLLHKLIEVVFPIQPTVFWINRQLLLERESACDDGVIAVTGTPKPYATALTRVAELTLWARSSMLASGAAGNPSQLYRRVQRLLNRGRNIAPRVSAIPLLLGVFGVILLVSACARSPKVIAFMEPSTSATSAPDAGPIPDDHAGELPAQPGTQTRSFAVRPKEKLRVDIDRGEVDVKSWDKDQVQIVVTRKGDDIAEFVKHHHITITQQGGEVRVRAKADPKMSSSFTDFTDVRISYQITVPKEFNAQVSDSMGTVEIADLKGEVDAQVSLGTVRLSKIDGPAHGQSSQGRVDVTDCTGKLRANVSAGNVEIKRFAGPSVQAQSSMGNVSVEMVSPPTGDCSLNSSSGNVSVTVSPTAAVTVDAATSMGNVSSDLALTPPNRNMMGGSLCVTVNGGGPTLKLATSMGNIRIRKG